MRLALVAFVVLLIGLWFVRFVLPSQVDDVNPLMNCSEEVLDLADVYFVVPKFGGVAISGEWCESILSRNKELAMHGVTHSFEEFGVVRNEEYFDEGVDIFWTCFGFEPEKFKPGQLKWNAKNDWIKGEVEVELFWNQVLHKVYHCGDSGRFPNWLIRVF